MQLSISKAGPYTAGGGSGATAAPPPKKTIFTIFRMSLMLIILWIDFFRHIGLIAPWRKKSCVRPCSKVQILFQQSKLVKVIWIFDVVSQRSTRFPLSKFFCAKLKTKFDNVRLVSKKLLGRILSFTNHTFAWLPARTNSLSGRRALHVGDFSIYGKSSNS